MKDLKSVSEGLLKQMRDETEIIRQFITDFPDIYVVESEQQKRDRTRRSQTTRKIPGKILKTLRRGADDLKKQVDQDNQGGFPVVSYAILGFIVIVLYLIWDKLSEKMDSAGGITKKGSGSGNTGWTAKSHVI